MLVLTFGQAVFGLPSRSSGGPGILARILFILGYTLVGTILAAGSYWVLNHRMVQASRPFRWVGMSLCLALGLTIFTLALRQFDKPPALANITRPSFVISTGVLSVIVGGLFGYGLLFRTEGPERVYLSPAQFQALSPTERDLLQPASGEGPEPPKPSSAV
jgi:cytochrome c biogenesis protein CcdA